MNIIYVEDMSESYMILSEEQQQEMDEQRKKMNEQQQVIDKQAARIRELEALATQK